MLQKLIQSFGQSGIDLDQILSKIDLTALRTQSTAALDKFFSSLDQQAQHDIKDWFLKIQEIKNNVDLDSSAKKSKISEMKTNEVVQKFWSSVLEIMIDKIPLENKNFLKQGLTGAGFLLSMIRPQYTALASIVVNQAAPQFIMSKQFDEFSSFMLERFQSAQETQVTSTNTDDKTSEMTEGKTE